jgi:arylsulfatase I/J
VSYHPRCPSTLVEGDNYVDLWENSGPAYGQNGTYSCDLYGAKAVEHILQHDSDVPLFMYVAFHNMHAPDECPPEYYDKTVDFKPRQVVQGMVTCVSIATGNITAALKSKGMWENTLFVWSGDNGGFSVGEGNNHPLRGGKMTDYQGGEKDTKLAQKLDQLQPFLDVFPQECMGQLASFGPT